MAELTKKKSSMNVLFVYMNPNGIAYVNQAILYLSPMLKKYGHKTGLIDFTFGLSKEEAFQIIKDFSPDIICFSCLSNEFKGAMEFAAEIKKKYNIPLICGGNHVTVAPEDFEKYECLEGICISEGEYALVELVNKMCKGEEYRNTPGFWFRENGKIIRNGIATLVTDLDTLPFPDYDIFNIQKYLLAKDNQLDIKCGRGCPFMCSYCSNSAMQRINKTKYCRKESVKKAVSKMKWLKKKYNVKTFFMMDEIFGLNLDWLRKFSKAYPKEVSVPFETDMRADLCDEEVMKLLKKSMCEKVNIAIESGDEKLRNELLKKNVSNTQIIKAFRLAKEQKIITQSFNMVGLPFETKDQIEKTVNINRMVKPDCIQVSIYSPYKGTELYEFCVKNNLIKSEDYGSYYTSTYLKNPNLTDKEIIKLRKWFPYNVYEGTSKVKAYMLLMREYLIPYYLAFGKKIPPRVNNIIYRLIWHSKVLRFLRK